MGALREQKCEISTEALRCLAGRVEWLWRGMQQLLVIVAEEVGAHVALAAWLTCAADFEGVGGRDSASMCTHSRV